MRAARTLFAFALASLCAASHAGSALDNAKQRGRLVVGLDYVVPAYKAGAKFRTPETIDNALAEDLAKRLQLPLAVVRAKPGLPTEGNIALTTLAAPASPAALPRTHVTIPVGYRAGQMAIMRSDTTIKNWEQLKGRTVCVSEGGHDVGALAAKYGAIEQVYRAPADALIALRTGVCDATVHDGAMLEELIKLPEWKKFSARLPSGPKSTLAFVVPASDSKTIAALKQVAGEWISAGYPDALMKKAVQAIAFEVYLDQDVLDCH
jgi:polar amino acid transport system substrate-binding protein